MLQLTPELLEKLKKDYWYIFNEYQRKDALQLARELEKEAHALETSNLELFKQYQNFIAQLKWVAFPLMQKDFDMMSLVQNHLLDGLENEDLDLIKIVTDRGELLFENGAREFLSQLLSAVRANQQEIGTDPVMIKGETNLLRPSVKNWLLDYLRNSTSKNPSPIDESNYLFQNPNAKKLKEKDKKILGKLLAFYDNFKYVTDQIATYEMRQMMPSHAEDSGGQAASVAGQQLSEIPIQTRPPVVPRPMHAPRPTPSTQQSPYLEPIDETAATKPSFSPQPPSPSAPPSPATPPSYTKASESKPSQEIKEYYNRLASQPAAPKPPPPPPVQPSLVAGPAAHYRASQPPRPMPINPLSRVPQPPQPPPRPQQNPYLEPIDDAPKKPAPQRPPDDFIQGNIVDLSNRPKP